MIIPPPRPKRLLTVDDDRVWLEFFKTFAQTHYRVDVTKCFNVESSLVAMEHKEFDVVLVDVHMPTGNGVLDLYPIIRQKWPNVAVAIVTGHASDDLRRQVAEIGPARVVCKDDMMDREFIDGFIAGLGVEALN